LKKTFYEFFAGIGLIRLGFENYSKEWKCLWANDNAEEKRDTYIQNYGDLDFCFEDIWNVKSSMLPSHAFVATASFPCTDVSVAGYREGLNGKESGTFFAFTKILEGLINEERKPPIVMLENVQGLLTSNNGQDIITIIKALCDLDYFIDIIELNAVYFTPQSRPRIFIFGVSPQIAKSTMVVKSGKSIFCEWENSVKSDPTLRTKKIFKVMIDNEKFNWAAFKLPKLNSINKDLADILEEIPQNSELWWSEVRCSKLREQMSKKHASLLQKMMKGYDYSYGTVYRRIRNRKSMAELRTDGVAGCLRTPKGGSSKQILVKAGHGKFWVRLLTPREYARLQGVPEQYSLPKNENQALFGLGDAVCVPAISWIARHIFEPSYIAFNS